MNTLTKIACRTAGGIGSALVLYDAFKVGKQYSKIRSEQTQADFLEKTYFDSRTIENSSYSENSIRKKVFDLRAKNPIPALWGKIKGAVEGALLATGDQLPMVACSALALINKGKWAKWGAIGTAICFCYNIARNGFGLGKNHPLE